MIRMFWNIYSQVYDALLVFYPYQSMLQTLQQKMMAKPGMNILDLGTGTGNVILEIAHSDPTLSIVGVDQSSGMLKRAIEKSLKYGGLSNIAWVCSDLMAFLQKQKNESFDRIVISNVLYTQKDQNKFWSEMMRVLKPDGKIIVNHSVKGGTWPLIKEHLKFKSFFSLMNPKLLLVGISDIFINMVEKNGHFAFTTLENVKSDVCQSGGRLLTEGVPSYGGLNMIFEVGPK